MQPEHLDLLATVSDPRLQPGGDLVAHVVQTMDVTEDERTSRIHVADLGTGDVRPFTAGPGDSSPRWSPDGSRLAFLRSPDRGEPAQLAVMPADGGEARVLTDLPLGVSALAWAPAGDRVVVAAAERRADVRDLDDDERAKHPRRITELGFRWDGRGWLHDRTVRLWVVDLDDRGTEPRAITPDDHDASEPVVTDDGHVVFLSPRHDDRETLPGVGIWRVSLDADGDPGALEELAPASDWGAPAVAPDGALLLCGMQDPFRWPAPPTFHRIAPDGAVTEPGASVDRDQHGAAGAPVVLDDGDVLLLVEDRGAVKLARFDVDGGHEVLVDGAQMVTAADATPDGSRVVYTATHVTDPGELWLLEDGEPRVLTNHNEALREHLLPVEHFTFERDGAELDAWAVLPEGDADGLPLLVNIHGGPTAQYGHAFFDEFQVEAGAGYAVVGCNPRGSSGRGADWSTAVVGAWTEHDSVDMLDLDALADATCDRFDRIDRDRVGIMGGSYGGYATARILARTDRYRSAIVERGLLVWPSFGGTSDIGAFFDRMFLGEDCTLPDSFAEQWHASPVSTAFDISTPTLVLHSLEDHRCPPEQAYQLFSMLRRNGVASELLLFPDEGHELSRSGSPKHRLQRFEAVLDWHARHLGPDDEG